MKRKVLISGVLPSPFEGPWISVRGNLWNYIPRVDFGDEVRIDTKVGEDITPHPLNGEGFTFEADFARGVVIGEPSGFSNITVSLHGG